MKMITVAIIHDHKGPWATARLFKSEEAALLALTNEFTMEDEQVPAKTLAELNEFLDGQYIVTLSQQEVE
jgi:hypothetical protein